MYVWVGGVVCIGECSQTGFVVVPGHARGTRCGLSSHGSHERPAALASPPAARRPTFFFTPGGENGFNQAIELSADMLSNVKFVQEKRLISRFFDEISQDTGKFVFSVKDTLACLEMGAVETLIVWESLDCDRCARPRARQRLRAERVYGIPGPTAASRGACTLGRAGAAPCGRRGSSPIPHAG